ncbi:MAG: hypothetical protein ACI9XJ_000295 [Marivirga sp.]|jgi:hypothetical protein
MRRISRFLQMKVEQLTITDFIKKENLLFSESFASMYYAEDLKLAGVVWHGSFSAEEYIAIFNRLVAEIKDKPLVGFYSDIRKQGIVPVAARKEFERTFSPRGKEMGIDKTGVVTDGSPFKNYYLNSIIRITGRPAKVTSNPDEALNYVLEGKL